MHASFALPGLALMVAMLIDWRLGEPRARWHPVVWMGAYLNGCGQFIAPSCAEVSGIKRDLRALALGVVAWCLGSLAVGFLAWWLTRALHGIAQSSALAMAICALVLGGLLKTMLSCQLLFTEVLAVERCLSESLAAGRERLSWLVSRDVSALTEAQVRESAIESLAENLNDSVVAPLFWFVLLGLPGAALYRFANTADAMWGYRGVRNGQVWEWAGKWAARADDLLSWLPARLTACLLWCVVRRAGRSARWAEVRAQAAATLSPNSGWPMGMMAMGLGVRLGKPGVYCLNPAGRPPAPADTDLALKYCSQTVLWLVPMGLIAIYLVAK